MYMLGVDIEPFGLLGRYMGVGWYICLLVYTSVCKYIGMFVHPSVFSYVCMSICMALVCFIIPPQIPVISSGNHDSLYELE